MGSGRVNNYLPRHAYQPALVLDETNRGARETALKMNSVDLSFQLFVQSELRAIEVLLGALIFSVWVCCIWIVQTLKNNLYEEDDEE